MTHAPVHAGEVRLAAGVVLHEPEADILQRQLDVLARDQVPVFAYRNGPLAGAAQMVVERAAPAPRRLGDDSNIGLGAGLNGLVDAALKAGFTHLFLLDQDSEPAPGLLTVLLRQWAALSPEQGKVAALAPRLVPPAGEGYRPIRYQPAGPEQGGMVPHVFLPTSGTLLSLAAFTDIGPFRDDYFIDGIDVEWGLRARSKGYVLGLVPTLTMLHRWGTPSAMDRAQILRLSGVRSYYYLRNAVATLRCAVAPLGWRLRTSVRLCAQMAGLVLRGDGRLVARALRDGWRGALGPAPADLVSRS